ncbi:hypothetical protein E4U54_006357 [Claviceps lovelessii]|nr:hypothetical protein E4U54_006357 [Claviceps lovelessii]
MLSLNPENLDNRDKDVWTVGAAVSSQLEATEAAARGELMRHLVRASGLTACILSCNRNKICTTL